MVASRDGGVTDQELRELVLRVERVTKPATAVMFVAAHRLNSRPSGHSGSTQRLEAMLLYSKVSYSNKNK